LMRFRTTYTNCPTVRSAGTRYLYAFTYFFNNNTAVWLVVYKLEFHSELISMEGDTSKEICPRSKQSASKWQLAEQKNYFLIMTFYLDCRNLIRKGILFNSFENRQLTQDN
jgi:hypothetical protein